MSSENPFNIPNEYSYLEHLTDNELDTLNKLSNKLRTSEIESKKLEHMSIKNLYEEWSKTHIDILKELSKFTGSEYKKYFKDIDQTEEWWKGTQMVLKDLFTIFTKDNRIIFISIMVFFISISR